MPQGRFLWALARPCRFIAHRRYPAAVLAHSRRFHPSPAWLSSTPSDPRDPNIPAKETVTGDIPTKVAEPDLTHHSTSETESAPNQNEHKDEKPYGSAVRRLMRSRKSSSKLSDKATTVPDWFRQRNVVVHDGKGESAGVALRQVQIRSSLDIEAEKEALVEELGQGGDGESPPPSGDSGPRDNRYALTEAMWEELCASARAGMRLPPARYAQEPSARKSHLVLQYPGADGILFLDAVVKRLAHEIGADLVTLNAQDIAELCSEQDLTDTGKTDSIRSLGYDVHRPTIPEASEDGMDLSEADNEDESLQSLNSSSDPPAMGQRFILGSTGEIHDVLSRLRLFNPSADSGTAASKSENRRLRLARELISPSSKKSTPPARKDTEGDKSSKAEVPEAGAPKAARDVILQVQDYGEIRNTREGSNFIVILQKAIEEKRKAGSRVLLVGTIAQEVAQNSDASKLMQSAPEDQLSQILLVTPDMKPEAAARTFTEDRRKRTLDINIRHIQEMLRTRLSEAPSTHEGDLFRDRAWPLDPSLLKQSGLEERYWSYSHVHWVCTLALGSLKANEQLSSEHLRRGIEMIQQSERVKNDWLQEKAPKTTAGNAASDRERLLKSLRKTCNSYEKKLLNGVVDARSIRTTFSDVHVPPETIDALKTLTSLSLIRPEAFTYGVLATDKIPGLLLYGPPGTGKTLLAKAVARESGATVLEVSGSEVYDMYVGEGEKNVKAIFTLAKKLSPCVVFIDEADAIFCSRTRASSRTSHRELINQFLREWDGMNDLSAFIMVATNRPFDLDDAVLRRLPRRLLVDLPTEKDRLAILKIHLKDEHLDSSVDLAELARRTPLYSGSDLKNLSVAAALACVREENELAAQHQGAEPYQYPARRTLTWKHFERGMEEISASISEDMASLSAIRKFDEQYGDRKGRRKKSPGWGFVPAGVDASAAAEDVARVRTLESSSH
ncbi:ATP-binding protein [Aspergillus saccharolyticus JOP 1030-1]|uniref:Mitochondrial AAA ATPase n=1 Tax=Aspergillus saccharolyticus JOP 1030-1 TaxID=1450539 RepID=A0A318ZDZ7_9EURO|nr:mitochondrial AAA ATPase [Aspergillus saccharolyticus JOP 1030-1]PYH44837.1 mitochondrial AAA ATPase [Aspergillus saccharolyticus JOP 1030-1]